jgi:hypothetical protein
MIDRSVSLLRRSHVHHRDLRGRLPTTSQAGRTSRRNQDRYVMSASANSRTRTTERLPRWSPTGHGGPPPHAPRHRIPRRARTPHPSSRVLNQTRSVTPVAEINRPTRPAALLPPLRSNQIAIDKRARRPSSSTSRGFLPWRLSDDGPRARGIVRERAVIRNPSQFLPPALSPAPLSGVPQTVVVL